MSLEEERFYARRIREERMGGKGKQGQGYTKGRKKARLPLTAKVVWFGGL